MDIDADDQLDAELVGDQNIFVQHGNDKVAGNVTFRHPRRPVIERETCYFGELLAYVEYNHQHFAITRFYPSYYDAENMMFYIAGYILQRKIVAVDTQYLIGKSGMITSQDDGKYYLFWKSMILGSDTSPGLCGKPAWLSIMT
ncbi:unnamed protein product [Absidia cylindrospora]